jgi:hypothetical protein
LWEVKDETPNTGSRGLRQRATGVLGNDVNDLTHSSNDIALDVCKLPHAFLRDKGIWVKCMS